MSKLCPDCGAPDAHQVGTILVEKVQMAIYSCMSCICLFVVIPSDMQLVHEKFDSGLLHIYDGVEYEDD